MRINTRLVAIAALVCALAGTAHAQTFPIKPVRLVVPNAPGGAIDILARMFAQHLSPLWGGQSVLVEYKPGANTIVGTEFVAKSAPDGHTIGLVVTSHVINPSLRANLPYDTLKDLSGVTMTAISHILISASPAFEANTLAEVIALAKKQPGKLTYASPGAGSAMHLTGELLKTMTGVDMLHVPFKGSGPAYPEVMAGRIPLLIDPLFSSLSYIKSGKLKPIAVTSAKREAMAPDIATVAETLPGFSVQSINGIVVPAATPKEIVRRLNADFVKVLQLPEMRSRMAEFGLTPVGNSPEEFDGIVRAEMARWAKVVKESGAKAD
jgi:tripartite-type tricarboxylate transporter receptor subunit TctC